MRSQPTKPRRDLPNPGLAGRPGGAAGTPGPRGRQRGRAGAGEPAGIAARISTTGRVGADAGNESGRMKKLEFLQAQVGSKTPQVFRANILEVRNYGLLIELPDVLLTGLIHLPSLAADFSVFYGAPRRIFARP